MIDTSLIVTLYQGNQYLPYLLQIAEANFINMKKQMGLDCEIIFVNDEPGKKLPVQGSVRTWGEIVVCNAEKNQGIHGARQRGVKLARGRYLIILDQDDKIEEDYIVSQRSKIGNCAAVVCNGYFTESGKSVKWHIYNSLEEQKNAEDLEKYLSEKNQIISPGQVLLKKSAIPDVWMVNTMKSNGADDFLLWLLMLFEGKTFAVNTEHLYVHVGHEKNVSRQAELMHKSIKEAVGIIKEYTQLSDMQKVQLEGVELWRKREEEAGKERTVREKYIFKLLERWTYLESNGISLAGFFRSQGIERLVIYGFSYIGESIFHRFENVGINVICGIDRRADRMVIKELPVVKLDDEIAQEYLQQTDAVVVTSISGFQEIKEALEMYTKDIKVYSFEEIIQELFRDLENEKESP